MRIFLKIFLFLIPINLFATSNSNSIDSIKNIIVISNKNDLKPDTQYINYLNLIASRYSENNPDSTLFYTNKAKILSQKINYKYGEALALFLSADISQSKGSYQDFKKNINKAISLFQSIHDLKGLSKCYSSYSYYFGITSDFKSQLYYLNLSLDISKKLGDTRRIGEGYKDLANVYASKVQYSTLALDYYYKSLEIELVLNNKPIVADIYNDIGDVFNSMEMHSKALDYFHKALIMYKGIKSQTRVCIAYLNIGETYLAQKEYYMAIDYLMQSLKIAKLLDNKDLLCLNNTDLGLSYSFLKKNEMAFKYLSNASEIATKYDLNTDNIRVLNAFASFYNAQKNYEKAYTYAIKAKDVANKYGYLDLLSNSLLQLHHSLAGLNNYKVAYEVLFQYNKLRDSLFSNENIQKLTSFNLEADFNIKQKQIDLQQQEKVAAYKQRIAQQRWVNTVSMILVIAMIAISMVYYLQRLKQQKINTMLEIKNKEVLDQKADIDEQAQKLNSLNSLKDRLISVLAHDLRAPLSTLRGLFGLLQDDTISYNEMLEMIPSVLKKLEYTSDFLDTLLFWINSQMENFENFAKSFYIKEVVVFETSNYQEQATLKGISLIDNVPADLVVSADPNSIRIVIRNLVTNAIKFSNQNDNIEITAGKFDESNIFISVKDTGTGMNEEQLDKIFKTKVNSKVGTQNESGTGMGMLFCKDLVEKCNGKIWVKSKIGEGTEFTFTIPIGTMKATSIGPSRTL